jgi:hypothetical protein
MAFQPGENAQEIYTDKNGVRYDAKSGNVIPDVGPQAFGANEIAYYTASGQPLRYANVYPGPVNVHQNQALTDLSVAYELDSGMFIAPEISPIRTVDKRSDIFYKIAADDVTRNYGNLAIRAIGATANEISQGFDTDTYSSVDYAFRDFVPDKVAANADQALQLTQATTKFLTDVLELAYERRIIAKMFDTATITNTTFAAATTGGAGTIATATITAKYITQALNTARKNMMLANNGKAPTHVTMDLDTAQRIAASSEIAQQAYYQIGVPLVTKGGFEGKNHGLPETLDGLKVVVVSAVSNSAARGQTASNAFLLSGTIGLHIVEPAGLKTRNNCTTFRVGGLTVRSYRDEARKGTWIEVEMDQDEKLTNANGGYLLTSC